MDGKPLDQYKQRQAKILRIWESVINEKTYRVVLGNNNQIVNLFQKQKNLYQYAMCRFGVKI